MRLLPSTAAKKSATDRHFKRVELSEFYGFSCLPSAGLTPDELLALEGCRPRIKARRTLEAAQRGEVRLTAEGWFDVTIVATGGRIGPDGKPVGGDQEAAQAAFNNYAKGCLKSEQTPE